MEDWEPELGGRESAETGECERATADCGVRGGIAVGLSKSHELTLGWEDDLHTWIDRDAVIVVRDGNIASVVAVEGARAVVSGARGQVQVERTWAFHHSTVKGPGR